MKNLLLSATQSIFPSFITGLFCVVVLFLICVVAVAIGKLVYDYFKQLFGTFKKPQPPREITPPPPVKKPRKKIRSIELDPDQVDRIIVRKP